MAEFFGILFKERDENRFELPNINFFEENFRDNNVCLGASKESFLRDEKERILLFSGEIYNDRALREVLYAQGYRFGGNSDLEVVLAAYDYWGESCVEHFDGSWAWILYDKKLGKIFCSRDRFGIKTLYFYEERDRIIFSSNISLFSSLTNDVYAEMSVMIPFITRGFLHGSMETFFRGIYRLNASSNMICDLCSKRIEKIYPYYVIGLDERVDDISLSSRELLKRLRESVALRFSKGGKIGACLSGGLDSSMNVALLREQSDDVVAIHAKSSQKESDESAYAKMVASQSGVKLEIIEPTFSQFVSHIDEVFLAQGSPFASASIFMEFFVMKHAQAIGLDVMFDGEGSDELFLGYEHYLAFILRQRLQRGEAAEDFFADAKLCWTTPEWIVEEMGKTENVDLAWEIIAQRGNFRDKYLQKDKLQPYLEHPKTLLEFQKRSLFDAGLPASLYFKDRDCGSFGIRCRLPYLSQSVVEFALSLPLEMKFQKGYLKYILRESMALLGTLSDDIVWRYNKFGFDAPQDFWVSQYKKEMLELIAESRVIKELFHKVDIRRDDFLWKLFSIAKWEQVFNVRV